jgi:RHS repeat-associated protein
MTQYLSDGAHFSHANVLDSETQTTDWAGGGGQGILFYPWGQVWSNPSGKYGSSFLQKFASLQLDDTSTDGYAPPFRYYIPEKGRWLTPDPLAGHITNPQSLNRYAYVLNNPTRFIDPLGLYHADDNGNILGDYGGEVMCDTNDGCLSWNADSGEWDQPSGYGSSGPSTDSSFDASNSGWSWPGTGPVAFDPVAYYNNYVSQRQQAQISKINHIPTPAEYIQAIADAGPTTCGGGVFGYLGAAAEGKGAEGFAGGLAEYDTKTGGSASFLGEVGSKWASGGVAANKNQTEPLLFVPAGPVGEFGGLVLSGSGVGFYVGTPPVSGVAPSVGGGAYVNITTNAGCPHP